jgi:hypothetical protein
MTSPIADGVLAATHRLVQQAMSGQWQDVPKTIEERRLLLDKLSASASSQDRQWLGALQQAMAESDAAVAAMTPGLGPTGFPFGQTRGSGLGFEQATPAAPAQSTTDTPDSVLDMILGSKG